MTNFPEAGSAELALWMINVLQDDDRISGGVRALAGRQLQWAVKRPALVINRLERAAAAEAERLQARALPPEGDLARCVSPEVFFDCHLDDHARGEFLNAETFRRFLDSETNPDSFLLDNLRNESIVFPAIYSWLIARAEIEGLDGNATVRAIQVPYFRPPVVVFVLPSQRLRQSPGVRVRVPCAVDAIPRRHQTWSRLGLAEGRTELIDADVPRTTVGGIEWRA